MRVVARAARTGIMLYPFSKGENGELVPPDPVKGSDYVKVYTPPEVLFSSTTMASFVGAPVTLGHEKVTDQNVRDWAVGYIDGVRRDGKFAVADITLFDDYAKDLMRRGLLSEVSIGCYTRGMEIKEGVTPDGERYEMVVRDGVRINHLAFVPKGRCGPECRVTGTTP